jgi:hypothetical protein
VTEQPERPKHLELRASDTDRERIARILHDAMADGRLTIDELDERLQATYAAKTLGDLVPLTVDLAARDDLPPLGPSRASLPDGRIVGSGDGPSVSVAVLSGFSRKGEWTVSPVHTAVAVMGGGELDLTSANFVAAETVIYAYAFWGGIEIRVPDDITVHVEGFGFMGGFDHKGGGNAGPGAPVVRVRGLAIMGGIDVKRPKKSRWRRKQIDN